MDDVKQRKKELRARLRKNRDALDGGRKLVIDRTICLNVTSLPEFVSSSTVLTYLDMGSEVDTHGIIQAAWSAGKRVALPRVTGKHQMRWYLVEGPRDLLEDEVDMGRGLQRSRFGVLEPPMDVNRELVTSGLLDAVAVVPGFTFDRRGYRLGYGGGFYDTFLSGFPGVAVGICRANTLTDELDIVEPHDRNVQIVVTESGILRV